MPSIPESYVAHRGASEQPCFLMLHGLGLNKSCFNGLEQVLRERGIAFVNADLPGHGYAASVDVRDSKAMAQYLKGILDHAGIELVTPIGYSLGGAAALALARHHPACVRSLALVAWPGELSWRTLHPLFLLVGHPLCAAINLAVRWRNPIPSPEVDFSTVPAARRLLHVVYLSSLATGWEGSNRCVRLMRRDMLRDVAPHVRCPVLLIRPRWDILFAPWGYRYAARQIAGATLHSLACGHNLMGHWRSVADIVLDSAPSCEGRIYSNASAG